MNAAPPSISVTVRFYSYFKELAACEKIVETLPSGARLGELQDRIHSRFPRLAGLQKSTLMAVGVEYQDRTYILQDNDEVSLFPPVQGG